MTAKRTVIQHSGLSNGIMGDMPSMPSVKIPLWRRLSICGLAELEGRLTPDTTAVVSLLDPGYETPDILGRIPQRHRFSFFDVIDPSLAMAPTPEDVARLIEVGSTLDDAGHVLVHCHAGMSRSTASALLFMVLHGASPQDAVEHLMQVRFPCWPNSLLVRMADEQLDLGGTLVAASRTVYRRMQQERPDYVAQLATTSRAAEIP
jgi:predicted protein tyrosine phosphatase